MNFTARNFLTKALQEAKTELEIAGAIQVFEVCYKLMWKTCKKILSRHGINVYPPKEVFRIAGLEGLIVDTRLGLIM